MRYLAELLALSEANQAASAQTLSQLQRTSRTRGRLNDNRLVVLRLGLGRDSMTMLVLLAAGELVVEGKKRGPDEVDAVVFTDPGHEWSFTYDLIPRVQAFCNRYKLRFLVQSKPPKDGPKGWFGWMQHQMKARVQAKAKGKTVSTFGTPTWRLNPPASIEARCASGYYHDRIPLFDDYGAKDAWIGKDDSSCTINHKIKPNRELLVDLMVERFGEQDTRGLGEKLWYTKQGAAWGQEVEAGNRRSHLMLIGYAADEQKRLVEARRAEGKREGWAKGFDSEAYPLIEMGITKGGEEEVLTSRVGVAPDGRFRVGGFSDVKKSGCRSCIHQDPAQWWMLQTLDPDYFAQMVAHEARVVARTGPWQAIFPRSFVAINKRTGKTDPMVEGYRKAGFGVTWAVQRTEPGLGSVWMPEVSDSALKKEMMEKVIAAGGSKASKLTRSLGILVVDKVLASSKRIKEARKLGVLVLDVAEMKVRLKPIWIRVPRADVAERAFIWIPIADVVARWEAEYRTKHGRAPQWEEVARKEYRGCPMEKA